MKKLLVSLLLLSVLVTGCTKQVSNTPAKEANPKFTEYLDDVLVDLMDPSSYAINFYFVKPEEYGIKPGMYEIGYQTEEEYKEEIADNKKIIEELKGFKDTTLTAQQQLDKKVIIEYLEHSIELEPYYEYLYGSVAIGYQRNLMSSFSAELETYQFRNKHDVDAYLHLIETFPDIIQKYIDLELKRQESGTGYGKEEIDEIIRVNTETAKQATQSDYYLIDHFSKTINSVDFMTAKEKEEAIAKHKILINDNFARAYQNVIDELGKIDAKPTTGLASKPSGKKYYELILRQETGKNLSIKEINELLDRKEAEVRNLITSIGYNKLMEYDEKYYNRVFGDFKDGRELLSTISSKYIDDFPEIEAPNYELRKVDASMEASSSPAFYFSPPVDYSPDNPQIIYINGNFNNNLYATYAHEGIPGHMYQFSYFMNLKEMHPIRSLISPSSNAEGWANYAENEAVKYVSDNDYKAFYTAMDTLQNIIMIRADIGIHYDGWNLKAFEDFMNEYYDFSSQPGALLESYVQVAHLPAVFPTYYLSSMHIRDLKLMVQQELDEKYNEKEFHRAFLNVGGASFDIIEEQLKEYIKSVK